MYLYTILSGDQEIRSVSFGLILSQKSRPTFLLFCIMTAIFSVCWDFHPVYLDVQQCMYSYYTTPWKKYILQNWKNLWSWICCNIFNWGFVIPDKHRIFGAIHQVRIGWKPSRQPFRPQGSPFPGKRKEKHFFCYFSISSTHSR